MEAKKNDRGPDPTPLTIHMLCAHSAGRCQFMGCNKVLFTDHITLKEFNNTNVAHIVSSSPKGPRGDAIRSQQLSQSLDNLMLMCQEHHKLIDDYPQKYTEDVLKDMKQNQERQVFELCEAIGIEPTEILMFTSSIKGKQSVSIKFKQAVEAIQSKKRPAKMYGMLIEAESVQNYRMPDYWTEVEQRLLWQFDCTVRSALRLKQDLHFSVFPIAPIPLIAKLGYLMGDKIRADIYQKTRNPDTWDWQTDNITNNFTIEKHELKSGNKISLVLSLTADIAMERILNVFDADTIYTIRAERFGVDCISSEKDLSIFWHKYQEVCDTIRNEVSEVQEISVFPAIPVSAAFEIGRRYMPGVYPALKIYEDDNGFFDALTIGG